MWLLFSNTFMARLVKCSILTENVLSDNFLGCWTHRFRKFSKSLWISRFVLFEDVLCTPLGASFFLEFCGFEAGPSVSTPPTGFMLISSINWSLPAIYLGREEEKTGDLQYSRLWSVLSSRNSQTGKGVLVGWLRTYAQCWNTI